MTPLRLALAAGLMLATAAQAAEARCRTDVIVGNYSVQVQSFRYDRGYGCEFNEQGCGYSALAVSTCTLRLTSNTPLIANVRITCSRSLPSDWEPRPFGVQCRDGCPHHQLQAVGRGCEWDLVDLNGDIFSGDITYRVIFSADRQHFIGSGAAGTHSDVDHDGRDGIVASLVGVRR